MASDDQEVEAWYLEGWCFFLMAEQAQENGGKLDDLTWEELARDARDCLETCQMVGPDTCAAGEGVLRTSSFLAAYKSRTPRRPATRAYTGAHCEAGVAGHPIFSRGRRGC